MQRYETPTQAANEKRIVEEVQDAWRCKLVRPHESEPYRVHGKDGIRGLATITHRDYTFAWFDRRDPPGVIFSIAKHKRWMPQIVQLGVPLVFIVEAKRDLRWCVIDGVNHDGIDPHGGRSDRGNPRDREPCYLLTSKWFKPIKRELL